MELFAEASGCLCTRARQVLRMVDKFNDMNETLFRAVSGEAPSRTTWLGIL